MRQCARCHPPRAPRGDGRRVCKRDRSGERSLPPSLAPVMLSLRVHVCVRTLRACVPLVGSQTISAPAIRPCPPPQELLRLKAQISDAEEELGEWRLGNLRVSNWAAWTKAFVERRGR